MATDDSRFKFLDYVVLTVMLLISAGIGIYFRFTGGKQKTTQVLTYLVNELLFYLKVFITAFL